MDQEHHVEATVLRRGAQYICHAGLVGSTRPVERHSLETDSTLRLELFHCGVIPGVIQGFDGGGAVHRVGVDVFGLQALEALADLGHDRLSGFSVAGPGLRGNEDPVPVHVLHCLADGTLGGSVPVSLRRVEVVDSLVVGVPDYSGLSQRDASHAYIRDLEAGPAQSAISLNPGVLAR